MMSIAESGRFNYLTGISRSGSGGTVHGMFKNGFCFPFVARRTSLNATEYKWWT